MHQLLPITCNVQHRSLHLIEPPCCPNKSHAVDEQRKHAELYLLVGEVPAAGECPLTVCKFFSMGMRWNDPCIQAEFSLERSTPTALQAEGLAFKASAGRKGV